MAKFAAKDSNKNITLSPHGTGKVVVGTGAADATVQSDGNHNIIVKTGNSTSGSISIADGADGDISIHPNGTGTVSVGSGANDATITSYGNFDLVLQTGNSTTGSISISDGADGNITLNPNGTGKVSVGNASVQGNVTSRGTQNLKLDTNSGVDTGSITINHGASANIDITPNGTGEVNISKVDIDSGTIDGTTIGASSHTTGKFTTCDATTDFTVGGTVITDNTITDDGAFSIVATTSITLDADTAINTGHDLETSTTGKIKQKGACLQSSTHQSLFLG